MVNAKRFSTARFLSHLFIIKYSMLKGFSCNSVSMAQNLEYVGEYAPIPWIDFD